MKHKLCKIFIKNNNPNNITLIDYNPNVNHDYYRFIKENINLGFQQFILTSDLIIDLMDYYVFTKKLRINYIEFMEEDFEISRIIEALINNFDIDNYIKLKQELLFLSQNSSIEIKKIDLIDPIGKSFPISLFFQVNGIIGIDLKSYNQEKGILSNLIKNFNQGGQ